MSDGSAWSVPAWWHVARFTVREAVSRRLILAAVVMSALYLALLATGLVLASRSEGGEIMTAAGVSVLLTLALYAMYFLGAFLAIAMAVGAISGEVDSGALHAVLARPLSRTAYLLGRWSALAAMMGVYMLLMAGSVVGLGRLIVDYAPVSAPRAVALLVLQAVLLLSLALLASTRLSSVTGAVVVFSLFGIGWIAGIIEVIGEVLSNAAMVNVGIAASLLMPVDALWRGASYYSQSPIFLAQVQGAADSVPIFGSAPPAPALLVWASVYLLGSLVLAVRVFRRRDL